jgi:hypothetical protein
MTAGMATETGRKTTKTVAVAVVTRSLLRKPQ